MTRLLFTRTADVLISVAGWGVIVFLLGVPVVALAAVVVEVVSNVKGTSSRPSGLRAWRTSQADGPPVLRAIVAGDYARGDRAELLLADHPPDLILIGPSDSHFYFYAGGQSKDVQEVAVFTENGRLVAACVFTEKGRNGDLENPFGPLPLVVRSSAESPDIFRLEPRRALLALTGGGGVLFQRE